MKFDLYRDIKVLETVILWNTTKKFWHSYYIRNRSPEMSWWLFVQSLNYPKPYYTRLHYTKSTKQNTVMLHSLITCIQDRYAKFYILYLFYRELSEYVISVNVLFLNIFGNLVWMYLTLISIDWNRTKRQMQFDRFSRIRFSRVNIISTLFHFYILSRSW